jgi:general secretion pathway protein F/type IV pilus assembly protein PilC
MALFAYTARDNGGNRVTGRLEATNEHAVLMELESRGLAPITLGISSEGPVGGRRISTRSLARFYRQLSDLLRAGVPILRALRLLGGMRANKKLAEVTEKVANGVEDGDRLADSMMRFNRTFPEVQIAIIRAGERAGFLESALERLGNFLDHHADMRSKVIGNLIYPVVLLLVGMGIVIAALVFFVPRFEEFYADIELPLSTRILMGTSNLIIGWWPLLILALFLFGLLVGYFWRDRVMRLRWERVRLRMPVIGPLVRSIACARFCRVLGTMLDNGIPLIEAMQIARSSAGSTLLEEAIEAATEAVEGGDSLAPPLASSGMIDEDVLEMISVGESANNLPEVLVNVAGTLEDRVDRQLSIAIRLMEPALLLLLAGVVLFIFMALIVPMLRLSSSL